jgi:hypothetical protein
MPSVPHEASRFALTPASSYTNRKHLLSGQLLMALNLRRPAIDPALNKMYVL